VSKPLKKHLHILLCRETGVRLLLFSNVAEIDWGKILMTELVKPTLSDRDESKT
tara:strand:+ start:359 stop:520 length:162 start_codon:yes stop_codon:yes gene_type:complete